MNQKSTARARTSQNSRQTQESEDELSQRLLKQLKQYWGYGGFRTLQREAMSLVMQDRDSLVVLPTGGGKSLCFQVPAVSRDGLALVVSPLISLMKDQVDSLVSVGVPAACINSMQTNREKLDVADRIRRRDLKLLYIAPERLVQPKTLEFLQSAGVSFVAIDEAHCISQWGHDFRPEYRQLRTLKTAFPGIAIHGYTATATEQVREDIVEQLGLQNSQILVGSFDRPNLQYRVERRTDSIGQIQRILNRHRGESGVIYCISRKNVEATSEALNRLGFKSLPYHAGMSDDDRRRNQDAFIDESVQVIVATVAFGMGIDKSNVRFVIHAEMPRSLENYQQESGRAGRDGLEAECVLLYSASDADTWEFLMQDIEDPEVLGAGRQSLMSMKQYCISTRCRHAQLVEHFGQVLESSSCGACDFCLKEMEPVADPLVISQKILSCIVRQGERYGAAYTAQVLKGSRARRVIDNGHDRISTWGILKQEPEPTLRNWMDQLVSQGFLRTAGEFNCLEVTPRGRAVLRGEETPQLLRQRIAESAVQSPEESWAGVDRELFEELRQMRARLAVQKQVPPYIIFSDATLRDLAKHRPTKADVLLKISGIGERKRTEFGPVVLFTIQQWCETRRCAANVDVVSIGRDTKKTKSVKSADGTRASDYFDLFEQSCSMEDVALQLDRSLDTVSRYLAQYLELHRIEDISPWVPSVVQSRVEALFGQFGCERLKPVFEALNGEVAYSHLRLIAVSWRMQHHAT
ncbi:MAG: DNA helicase RecQ [Planctomycetota bacterium]